MALLAILPRLQDNFFEGLCTQDESWFLYEYQSGSIFAASREIIPPRCEHKIHGKKRMITVFFTAMWLLVLDTLSHDHTFTQAYFMTEVLWMLSQENGRLRRKCSSGPFYPDMGNSRCHNGKKITAEIQHLMFARALHAAYSLYLSQCDFWLFGLMKHSLKAREIRAIQDLISPLANLWDDLTFEDVQAVFLDWMEQPFWVSSNNGGYYIKRSNSI
jgi:hypothetical protein